MAKELAKKEATSFIFSNEMDELYQNNENFKEFADIILEIKKYARINLFVIKKLSLRHDKCKFIYPPLFPNERY